ncbi:MAG TPA: sigma-54 dependent transcriptional regulator [Nitrolancea sp.]|jgi:two-component system response regulator AtoC|nr:sigma-54 dependent transcriptional regulator [Nitrolancea sp.]
MDRILIADDDAAIRAMLREFLEEEGFTVDETGDSEYVSESLRGDDAPTLVLMDVRMPKKSGIDVLREIAEGRGAQLPFILMTAYGSASLAIQAMQLGAYDYITKPFDLDDVLLTIRRYFEHQRLLKRVSNSSGRPQERDPNEFIIGNSGAMQEVYKTVGRVAGSDATVLIAGETGTGKELVATVIHRNSGYAGGPLVKVNCAALPETLLESELFGHEKGAFTGAINQRKGRFELAHKGTIFLDEVGEMTLATQKKLLRVLQEREFERVGGSISVKVDTRVIAATNKVLLQEVRDGRFREDLFYRLNVIAIYLPPLRERKEDVPLLVEHFLDKHRYSSSSKPARISSSAIQLLMEHDWPGNVRELENIIERAVVLSQGSVITDEHVSFSSADQGHIIDIAQRVRSNAKLRDVQQEVEKQMLIEALKQTDGDQVAAADLIGLGLREFQQRLLDYGRLAELPTEIAL